MFQYDAANTGYNPNASIPTEQVGQQWRTSTLGEVVASPVIANGMVFVGSRDGKVYAMDQQDGSKQWEYNIGEPIEATPAVSDGSIYIGSTEEKVYSLSLDGNKEWEFETDPEGLRPTIELPISVGSDVVFVTATSSYENGELYAINKEDGTERWTYTVAADHAPVVGDGSIYSSIDSGRYDNLRGLDTSNGEVQRQTSLGVGQISGMTLSGTSLYYLGVEEDPYVYRVPTDFEAYEGDGEQIISFSDINVQSIQSPSVAGREIYISLNNENENGFLFAFDSVTGDEKWRNRLGGGSKSSPVTTGDTVYVATDNSEVIAFSRSSGDELWSFSTDGPIRSTPALVGGSLYVGSDDGYVYSLGKVDEASQTPTPTETPTEAPTETPQPQTTQATEPTTQKPSSTLTEEETMTPTATEDQFERGFFTNGGESSFAILNNPLVLTVGGFFLSVLGIVYQLVEGD
jgi:outer membrane protein assembly factor BamB